MFNEEAEAAKYLGNDVIQNPKGTRDLPARTCRHLAETNPSLPDGMYWIDPNGGRIQDTVEVKCRMETRQTCVVAKRARIVRAAHFQPSSVHQWFSKITSNDFDYAIDNSQLSFLKSLSASATQRLSFQCRGVAVVNNANTGSQKQAVRLWADNDVEMTYQHPKHSYSVVSDDCQYKKGSVGESVIEVTGRPHRLPIRDAALLDVGRSGQQIGMLVGEVCFS